MGIQTPITKKCFQPNSEIKHGVNATSQEETQDVVYPEKTNNGISVTKEPAVDDLSEDMEQVIAQLNLGSTATD